MNKPQNKQIQISDVVVIGGGPAGMMAAATAAARGLSVILLEKNNVLGKKLSITGGGRCNITNNKPDVRKMLASYKDEGKFLFSTFTQHGVAESIVWFEDRGVFLKEENEGRLFPKTESAETVRDALIKEMKDRKVKVFSNQEVRSILHNNNSGSFSVSTKDFIYQAKACVMATGGYARPETGSTGDGFGWLEKFGHTINPNENALVPVALKTIWTNKLSGLTLSGVKVSLYSAGKRRESKFGRILFTHFGVTGPLVLNMSKSIGDILPYEKVELRLDLFPQYEPGEFKDYLKELLQSNKKLQNALAEVLPLQLVKGVLDELKVDGEIPCHSVKKEDRNILLQYLKSVPLEVEGLLGSDKAIVSSGGVELNEIDFRTMCSKIVPNLYIVGDLLNINRPSGGYSLQLCWSTGFVAGNSVSK